MKTSAKTAGSRIESEGVSSADPKSLDYGDWMEWCCVNIFLLLDYNARTKLQNGPEQETSLFVSITTFTCFDKL